MLRNFNTGQEITFEDLNAISKAVLSGVFDNLAYEMVQRKDDSFFGDSFKVNFSNGTNIILKKGLGFQKLVVAAPEIARVPILSSADIVAPITAPHATLPRIDIVCVKSTVANQLTESRKFKNASTGVISNENLVVQKTFSYDLSIVAGTPNVAPVAPAIPAGYIKIAELAVAALTGMASQASITDSRSLMSIGGDLQFDTSTYVRLTQGVATKLSSILAEIDSILPKAISTFAIANNQVAAADVTGFTLDTSVAKQYRYAYAIKRTTNVNELSELGDIYLNYNALANTWDLIQDGKGDDALVQLSMVFVAGTTWKVQYTSSNLGGTGYAGTMKFQKTDQF